MRILKLEAQNINSLEGRTCIDFESFLRGEGLFAITGPTGSGKSTLLDILSCALYGRTPRLGRNPTELMSRQTGSCYCEVEFEVGRRRYRSRWSLRRARLRPDGRLQSARMELEELGDEPRLLSDRLSEVPEEVARITGLDFDRFTRSVMLAQGAFDSFLQAKESERAELLERMTGSEIYAEISRRTYEKTRESEQEYEREKGAVEAIETLPEEEREALTASVAAAKEERVKIETRRKSVEEKLRLLDRYEEALFAHRKSRERLLDATKQCEASEKRRKRLEEARRAATLEGPYETLKAARSRLAETRKALQSKEQLLGELEKAHEEAVEALRKSEKALEKKEKEWQELSPRLEEAEAIDRQTSLLRAEKIRPPLQRLQTLEGELEKLEKEKFQTLEKSMQLQKRIDKSRTLLQQHASDEAIEGLLPSLYAELRSYETIRREIGKLRKSDEELGGEEAELRSKMLEAGKSRERDETQSRKLEEKIEPLERKIQRSSGETERLHREGERLDRALPLLLRQREILRLLEQERSRLAAARKEASTLEEQFTRLSERIVTSRRYLELARQSHRKSLLIAKYETDRARLRPGEPCPLCGAPEHPYLDASPQIRPDREEEEIRRLEAELSREEENLRTLEKRRGATRQALQNAAERIDELAKELESLSTELKRLEIDPEATDPEVLRQRRAALRREIEELETRRKELDRLRAERESLREERRRQELHLAELGKELQSIELQKQRIRETLREKDGELERLVTRLGERLAPFGEPLREEKQELYSSLLERKERYARWKRELQEAEHEHRGIEKTLQRVTTELARRGDEAATLRRNLEKAEEELRRLEERRRSLIGEERIETIRMSRQEELETFRKAHDRSRDLFRSRTARKEAATQALGEAREALESARKAYEKSREAFESKGIELDFSSLEAFEAARMLPEDFRRLEQELDALRREKEKARALADQAERTLKALSPEAADLKRAPLEEEAAQLRESSESLLKDIAAREERLRTDAIRREEIGRKLRALEELRRELSTWEKLNDLIGSADGRKFSRFAQAITLEHLVHLANRHLERLSGRYRLRRADEKAESLLVEVIDRYQADEIRSVETLSGGENFLVSLALALALSELASRKVRIDSLFLDEGFGTLDPETLETALEALGRIESRGKTIGIISHVEALKEHIARRIVVEPVGGGRSRIRLSPPSDT